MKKTTREWVQKAEADYHGARKLPRGRPAMHDLVCFHCQQTAEKYLKAVLNEQGLSVPRTHDLEGLLSLLLPTCPELRTLRRGLKFLIQFAVEARYPEDSAPPSVRLPPRCVGPGRCATPAARFSVFARFALVAGDQPDSSFGEAILGARRVASPEALRSTW